MILSNLGNNAKLCAAAIFSLIALCTISSATIADEAEYIMNSESPGMQMTFDGSSVEAFDQRMEEIEAETTAEEYVTIQQSIEYMLVYDLAARRDREVLYERLDGKTPVELISMVKWRLEGRKINERG
ncbi:MAG TPA: hypothetical protein VJ984_08240 [Xanthomonadales bacterium]|nr:hypothetical protein [Xanthomonadales bacterium]